MKHFAILQVKDRQIEQKNYIIRLCFSFLEKMSGMSMGVDVRQLDENW